MLFQQGLYNNRRRIDRKRGRSHMLSCRYACEARDTKISTTKLSGRAQRLKGTLPFKINLFGALWANKLCLKPDLHFVNPVYTRAATRQAPPKSKRRGMCIARTRRVPHTCASLLLYRTGHDPFCSKIQIRHEDPSDRRVGAPARDVPA